MLMSFSYSFVLAQGTSGVISSPGPNSGLAGLMDYVTDVLAGSVIGLIFALAFVYFMWGVVQYALYPDDEGKKDKGKQTMIWGIIALTVMFSVYGLIRVVRNTFNLNDDGANVQIPKLPN